MRYHLRQWHRDLLVFVSSRAWRWWHALSRAQNRFFFPALIASCMHFLAFWCWWHIFFRAYRQLHAFSLARDAACMLFPAPWRWQHFFSRLMASCMHFPAHLVPVACIFSCFLLPRKVSRSLRSMADPRLSIKSRLENPPLLQYSDKNLYRRKKCKKNIEVKLRWHGQSPFPYS